MSDLVVERVNWTAGVEKRLAVSAGSDLREIASEVNRGVSRLWWCSSKKTRAYIVTRIENFSAHNELVLVLGEGRGFDEVIPYLLSIARERGLSFRTHVTNKALIRMYEKYGVFVDEYVLGVRYGR